MINKEGNYRENTECRLLFDDNGLTYVTLQSKNIIGIKLEKPEAVSYITYISRNDQNGVYAGDDYELLYFENSNRFNKTIATATIRFMVTVAILAYKGLTPVLYRMLTNKLPDEHKTLALSLADKIEFIEIGSIVRCEAENNYTTFYLKDGSSVSISRQRKERGSKILTGKIS